MNTQNPSASTFAAPATVFGVTSRRRLFIVVLLFIASLINYLDRATISMALPLIAKEFTLGPVAKGVLLSAFFWSYALMQVPIGWCADRSNLRRLYAGMFLLWSLAQGLTGFAGSLAVLISFRILLGVGESIYLPGGTKIVSLLFSARDRGLPSGFFDAGTRTGLVLEGVLIPWLLMHYGWRRTFMVVGFAALVWLIPWLAACPRNLSGQPASRQAASPETPGRSRMVTFNRDLLGICLGFFCFDYYWYLLVTWLPDYLVTVRHLTVMRAGFYSVLPYFVFGASQPLGGWVADHLIRRGWDQTRTRKGVITFAFLTGLLLIPAARAETANGALALIIGGSLVGLSTGNFMAIVQSCAPPDEIGVWTGFENFTGNVAGVLAPIVTGILIKRTGSYSPGFALAALLLVTGLLAYWFIVGKLKPMANP